MKPRDQDRLLIVAICVMCLAALAYCSLTLFAFLASKGVTFREFDAAAWTQAVGSIAAIAAGAVGLWWQSNQQARTAKKLKLEQQTDEASQVLMALLSLTSLVLSAFAGLKKAGQYEVFVMSEDVDRQIQQATDSLTGLDPRLLSWTGTLQLAFDLRYQLQEFNQIVGAARVAVSTQSFTSEMRSDHVEAMSHLNTKLKQSFDKATAAFKKLGEKSKALR